jgi:ABC-2 type transport system ATP-binding protein
MGVGDHLRDLDSAWRDRLFAVRKGSLSDLRTVGLVKTYGTTEALRGIDLEVPAGSVYGLVGPNGAGKTTALEILAGLRDPTSGRVELGVDPKSVAYCPDAPEFEPWLTALEVVDLGAGLLGKPRRRTELREMLHRVGLSDAADRPVGGFSRGMRSRLGLAAGLIGEPTLLVADEPAAALDPVGRWKIIDLLAGLAGVVTVIVSSHDLPDVERICDHVGVMAHGQLVYQGPTSELLKKAVPALRVVVRPPAARLVAALRAASWVRSVREAEPGELVLDVNDTNQAEQQLPTLLADCESRLVELERAHASLQEIFFELTATGPAQQKTARQN